MTTSEFTKSLLRGALDKAGIYYTLQNLFTPLGRSNSYATILRIAIINLLEHPPNRGELDKWRDMIDNVKKFDKYLETKQ